MGSVDARKMGTCPEFVSNGVFRRVDHFLGFSSLSTGHFCEYELCWGDFWRCFDYDYFVVVWVWEEGL